MQCRIRQGTPLVSDGLQLSSCQEEMREQVPNAAAATTMHQEVRTPLPHAAPRPAQGCQSAATAFVPFQVDAVQNGNVSR